MNHAHAVRAAGLLIAAVSFLAPAGCIGPQPRPPPNEGRWARVRDRATRVGKLYDRLATNAFASAVYQSREVREARVDRLAEWEALTRQERDAMLARERDEAARYEDFLVTLFTPDRASNDLDAAHSVWRVALVVPGRSGEADWLPESIHLVKVDAMLRELYPNIGNFDYVYAVRFARRAPLQGPFVLRLAGALGRLDFEY